VLAATFASLAALAKQTAAACVSHQPSIPALCSVSLRCCLLSLPAAHDHTHTPRLHPLYVSHLPAVGFFLISGAECSLPLISKDVTLACPRHLPHMPVIPSNMVTGPICN
jgi:hypothetical protein